MDYGIYSWLVAAAILAAVFFTFKLWEETRGERYWFFFLLSALGMLVHHSVVIPMGMGLVSEHDANLLSFAGELVGGLSLAYASFGLWKSMRHIRKRVG
jgi:hypothetical protein